MERHGGMARIFKNDKRVIIMYTIVVAAAASRLRGALTMYNQFLDHLKNHLGDKYYIFVHPSMPKPQIDGVVYIEIDITSPAKRLKFDYYGCAKYLRIHHIKADFLFSFENTGVRANGIPQFILYQQGLPFYPQKWNPFKSSERGLFFNTYIYPLFVKLSLFRNSKVIVHTPYLRELFAKKYHFDKDKIFDMLPDVEKVNVEACEPYDFGNNCFNFLYPANNAKYKEHNTLVRALIAMKDKNPDVLKKIKVHLSLKKENNQGFVDWLIKVGLIDNFVFEGFISRNDLLSMYKSCTGLLFPSVIESVTLPLWEAVAFRKPIICQDLNFAHYQLDGYRGVKFIEVGDFNKWCDAIVDTCIQNKEVSPYTPINGNSWENLFDWIKEAINDYKKIISKS